MALRYAVIAAMIGLVLTSAWPPATKADQLPGRLITFKKTFDGWWDVACDTAPDGSDPRCYVQYVDPYRVQPKLRAAMVDFLYRRRADGASEPVITLMLNRICPLPATCAWQSSVRMAWRKRLRWRPA